MKKEEEVKKFGLVITAAVLVLAMLAVGCVKPAGEGYKNQLVFAIATKPESGDYPVQCRIATLGAEAIPASVTITTPGGSDACTEALLTGEADLCNSNAVTVISALEGMGNWEGKTRENILRGLNPRDLQDNVVAVVAGSGITKMSDLVGKSAFYGHPGTNCNANMKRAMVALGYDENIEEYVGSLADGVAAMKDRRVDAYVKTTRGEVADATHIDILVSQELELITFTKAEVDKIHEMYPWVTYRQLSTNAFKGQMKVYGEGWVNTDKAPTLCNMDLPEEWAYNWVKHEIENWDQLVALMASLGTFDPLDFPMWVSEVETDFYLHPGAVRYYREMGIQVPDNVIPPEMK